MTSTEGQCYLHRYLDTSKRVYHTMTNIINIEKHMIHIQIRTKY